MPTKEVLPIEPPDDGENPEPLNGRPLSASAPQWFCGLQNNTDFWEKAIQCQIAAIQRKI